MVVHKFELQSSRLPDQGLGPSRILQTGELDQNPVPPLPLNRRFGDPEFIDPIPDRLQALINRGPLNPLNFLRLQAQGDMILTMFFQIQDPGITFFNYLFDTCNPLPVQGLYIQGVAHLFDQNIIDSFVIQEILKFFDHPVELGINGLVHLHPQDKMHPSLQVEPKVDLVSLDRVKKINGGQDTEKDCPGSPSQRFVHPRTPFSRQKR